MKEEISTGARGIQALFPLVVVPPSQSTAAESPSSSTPAASIVKTEGQQEEPSSSSSSNTNLPQEEEEVVKADWNLKLHVLNLPQGLENPESHLSEHLFPYGSIFRFELVHPHCTRAYVYIDTSTSDVVLSPALLKALNKTTKIQDQRIFILKSDATETPSEVVGPFQIHINYIPVDRQKTRREDIRRMFEAYGKVIHYELHKGQRVKFVWLENDEVGKVAVQDLNGKVLPDFINPLMVSIARNPYEPDKTIPTVGLQVKGIPEALTAYEVRSLFQPYGTVVRTTLRGTKEEGGLRCAVVELDQLGDIRSAIKDWSGVALEDGGTPMKVEPCNLEAYSYTRPPSSSSSSSEGYHKKAFKRDRSGAEYAGGNYDYDDQGFLPPPPPRPPPLLPFHHGFGGGPYPPPVPYPYGGGPSRGFGGRGLRWGRPPPPRGRGFGFGRGMMMRPRPPPFLGYGGGGGGFDYNEEEEFDNLEEEGDDSNNVYDYNHGGNDEDEGVDVVAAAAQQYYAALQSQLESIPSTDFTRRAQLHAQMQSLCQTEVVRQGNPPRGGGGGGGPRLGSSPYIRGGGGGMRRTRGRRW